MPGEPLHEGAYDNRKFIVKVGENMGKPFSLVLNATETAVLLLLNNAVLDVIDGNTSEDVISELKEIQPNLEQMLFKKEIPLT